MRNVENPRKRAYWFLGSCPALLAGNARTSRPSSPTERSTKDPTSPLLDEILPASLAADVLGITMLMAENHRTSVIAHYLIPAPSTMVM